MKINTRHLITGLGIAVAVAGCASAGEVFCGLRFRAHAGELEIDVTSSGGGRIWHASRRTA